MPDIQMPLPEDALLYEVVRRFLKNPYSTQAIAAEMNEHFGTQMTREQVYPELRKAVRRKLLTVCPTRDQKLEEELRRRRNKGEIYIANAIGPHASEGVPVAAAKLVLEMIKRVGQEKREKCEQAQRLGKQVRARPAQSESRKDEEPEQEPPDTVHIGLGIGWSTMRFSWQLGALLRDDTEAPPIAIHALAPSYSFWSPLETPIASFTCFADAFRPVTRFHGLFSLPFVSSSEYEEHLNLEIVRQAFDQRERVDIVVTSLAGAGECKHGYLLNYLQRYGGQDAIPILKELGWRGDVQLRPYSDRGPISVDRIKMVTLFELDDLVKMVDAGKRVVLLSSPCGRCFRSKARALQPLLDEPSLRVWSHLVVDYGTAFELVTGEVHPSALYFATGEMKGRELG